MAHRAHIVVPSVLALAVLQASAMGQGFHLERITPVLNQPTYLTQAPGDPANVMYYSTRISSANSGFGPVNSMGKIWKYDTTTRTSTPVLDFSSREVINDTGLQTFSFHPDFNISGSDGFGKMYVATATRGATALNKVEEFVILNPDGSARDPATTFANGKLLLQYQNNAQNNHTVDWVGFDPNATGAERNYLYISTGDGAFGRSYNNGNGATGRPSQNPADVAGKILRIDISPNLDAYPTDPLKNFGIPSTNPIPVYNAAHPGTPLMGVNGSSLPAPALGEVYVTGVRNAYRMSFDRANSDIWLGDVGENAVEEVTFIKAGSNVNGPPVDIGWPQLEGTTDSNVPGAPHTNTNPFTGVTSIKPLQQYSHSVGLAVMGGYVYRGPIAELQGKYFYADFVNAKVWTLEFDRNTDPSLFNANNGISTDVTLLLNSLIVDPLDPFYRADRSLSSIGGLDHVVSFAEDAEGNLYLIDLGWGTGFDGQYRANAGEIFKIVPGAIETVPAAFWNGALGASWGARSGNNTNFNTNATSNINAQAYPNAGTDVVFATTNPGATNFSTTLDGDAFLSSLTITSGTPTVTINSGTTSGFALVLMGEGLLVENGASLNLGANLIGSVRIEGGSLNATTAAAPSLTIGNTNNNAARLIINGGTLTTASELWIANAANSYGYFEMNGGSASLGSHLAVARGASAGQSNMRGVVTINDGNLFVGGTNFIIIGSFQGIASELQAVMTINGGTVATNNGRMRIAEGQGAVLTINNDSVVNIVSTVGVEFTSASNTTGILNMNGGNLTATRFQVLNNGNTNRTSVINFNGGTISAGANATPTTFIGGLSGAFIYSGGATINDNGQNITVSQPLAAPTGSGVATIPVSGTISGLIGPPIVHITGGGGFIATAIANVDAAGVLQSITVTNPGFNYTTAPTVTLYGGGINGSITLTGATLAPNVAGGLTKIGTGTLNLTGVATYGGPTAVNAGLLHFNTNSTASNQIGTVSGAGAVQDSAGSIVTSNGVTLSGAWTISGTHNIRTGVGALGTSKVTNLPTITGAGKLNLADSILTVQTLNAGDKASKVSALNALISSGSAGGTWAGPGITSSVAATDGVTLGVGIFDNAILNKTSYGGQSADSNSLFVAVARFGDTNRDGIVDINDLGNLANRWQQPGSTWTDGDFNRDGFVDINDLGILASNWQQTSDFFVVASGISVLTANVPEPASLGVLAVAGGLLLRRRTRRG